MLIGNGCATPFDPVATRLTVYVPCCVLPNGPDDVPGVSAPATIVPGAIAFGMTAPDGNVFVDTPPTAPVPATMTPVPSLKFGVP
jgi:hypothetical protein